MITFKHKGSFKNTEKFLNDAQRMDIARILDSYGREGVSILASATPKDTGLTALSWAYEIKKTARGYSLIWTNSNIIEGVNIAVILQYGHGTGWGGYVQGQDYINPVMKPLFNKITENLFAEVSKL